MGCKRLIVIGDGIIYKCKSRYYVGGSAQLDFYSCFVGIEEVYIWSRIYHISEEETEKYQEMRFQDTSLKFHVLGIYDQKPGYLHYLTTFFERIRKMKGLFREPALIMCQPVSVSQWMFWYLFRKKNQIYIGRTIGDPEVIISMGFPFGKQIAFVMKCVSKQYYKKCSLQTWVSGELERKYKVKGVPSVVVHDFLMYEEQMKGTPCISKDGKLRLLFVGRLSKEKGVQILIHALKKLNNKDVLLTVIGDGKERGAIENLIDCCGLSETIDFKGYVGWGKEIFSYMAMADCLILPSYSEGLGMVLLEAMANGTAVIGSRVGGIPEIIKDGYNGYLFEIGDADRLASRIKILFEDRELLAELSMNAIKVAKRNSRDKQLEKFKKAYMKYVYPKIIG